MAWTTEDLATLEAVIASGARIVRYGDKEITYQTLDQMRALRREMQVELGISTGFGKKYYSNHSKGLT